LDTGRFHKISSYLPSWTQSEKGKRKLARARIARLRNGMSHVTEKARPGRLTIPVTEKKKHFSVHSGAFFFTVKFIINGLSKQK